MRRIQLGQDISELEKFVVSSGHNPVKRFSHYFVHYVGRTKYAALNFLVVFHKSLGVWIFLNFCLLYSDTFPFFLKLLILPIQNLLLWVDFYPLVPQLLLSLGFFALIIILIFSLILLLIWIGLRLLRHHDGLIQLLKVSDH